jgi:uncharacterized membrane protein
MTLEPVIRLLRDRRGATAVIVAGSLFALVGAAAVAVDLGSVYLAKRRLQGIADAAALAAAGDVAGGSAAARRIIDRSGAENVTIGSVTPGRYLRDKTVAMDARFVPSPTDATAARVVLRQRIPLFFGALLSREPNMTVGAEATASRIDMAAFSLGSRLAEVSGGVPNQILSALAGTQLGLTAADSQGLAAADVDILRFADALRVRVNQPDLAYAELFGMDVPLNAVVGAMADVSGSAGGVLSSIEAKLGAGTVKLSDLIDLGPLGESDFNDGSVQIKVDALSLLRSALELSQGDHYEVNLDLSALGLAGTKLTLVGGQGEVHSPWLTVTSSEDVVIRSAQTRLYLDTGIGSGPLGLLAIRLPVYVELAAAEARLTDIDCGGNPASNGVTLAVTPSVGTLAIADVDAAAMQDLTEPVALQPAMLAYTPIAQVDGYAEVALGGVAPQPVHFSRADIEDRRVRTVQTNDLAAGVATSLMQNVQISASLLGGSLLGGSLLNPLVSAVGSKLSVVTPLLDTVINQLTQTLGVRLGVADVRVDKLRCGVPMLVA